MTWMDHLPMDPKERMLWIDKDVRWHWFKPTEPQGGIAVHTFALNGWVGFDVQEEREGETDHFAFAMSYSDARNLSAHLLRAAVLAEEDFPPVGPGDVPLSPGPDDPPVRRIVSAYARHLRRGAR